MKTSLTEKETELMDIVKKEWLSLAFEKNKDGINKPLFEKGINWLYTNLLSLKAPQVIYCDSILSAVIQITMVKDFGKSIEDYKPSMIDDFVNGKLPKDFCEKMNNNLSFTSTYCGWTNFGWVSFYDYFTKINVINHEHFNSYIDIIKSNVFECFEFEEVVFAVEPPVEINRNAEGLLHNPKDYALKFKDGYALYFINGREFDGKLLTKGFTKDDFLKETNEDIRAIMFEIVEARGEGKMMEFLDAYEYGKEVIDHKNGEKETLVLYRTKETFPELSDINGNTNVPLCWLKLICPSTNTTYLISTDASFKTPLEAAKFHRDGDVPFELEYSWLSRS